MSSHGRLPDQPGGVGGRTPGCRGEDRLSPRGHRVKAMPAQERETPARRPWEPATERRLDPHEVRGPPRHRDHRDVQGGPDPVEVENVEPPDDRPVEQDRPHPFQGPEGAQNGDDARGAVGPVDPDPPYPHGLELLRDGDDDRGDRGEAVAPAEGAVVDGRHARVALPEGATQG